MLGVYKVRGVQVVGRFRHNHHMLVEVDRKVHKVQVVGRFRHNRHMLGEVDRKVQGEVDRKV